jgi:N-acetyl-gamma-glutamyl-phosphate reductase / acetylglutamate kinase
MFYLSTKFNASLLELNSRTQIRSASRIANPGCYATAAQVGIYPLREFIEGSPTIFGVSGYSGAGTKPSPKNDLAILEDNMLPYSLTGHIHEKEISSRLGFPVVFIPHVSSWFRGIQVVRVLFLCIALTVLDDHKHSTFKGFDQQRYSEFIRRGIWV